MFKKRIARIPKSIEEQTAIAQVLTNADEEIKQTQRYLDRLQGLYQSQGQLIAWLGALTLYGLVLQLQHTAVLVPVGDREII